MGLGQPASLEVKGRAQTPLPQRCESEEQSVFRVLVGICLLVVSCPICGNRPQSSSLKPAPLHTLGLNREYSLPLSSANIEWAPATCQALGRGLWIVPA